MEKNPYGGRGPNRAYDDDEDDYDNKDTADADDDKLCVLSSAKKWFVWDLNPESK